MGQMYELRMPSDDVNSELEVKPNTPKVMVGNLDTEAERNKETDKTVTITMTVESKEESAADHASDIKDVAGEGKSWSIWKLRWRKR